MKDADRRFSFARNNFNIFLIVLLKEVKMKSLNLSAFWRGLGSIFNLGGDPELLNSVKKITDPKRNPDQVDTEALSRDWQMVGEDLRWAIREYDNCK
jgi:hypothetical protein